jgi:hypothetical protein
MGANSFFETSSTIDLNEAFAEVREHAQWEHGHGGYTGTIAEKDSVTKIADHLPDREAAMNMADDLLWASDPRVNDKWGPAGAIGYQDSGQHCWLFFGMASS